MLGIATKLRARGAYKVQIGDPVKFLEKLIGNNVFYQTQEELNKYFINEFQSKIKSVIARAINESDTEILGIDSRLDELSDTIEPFMQEILNDYGLKCVKFTVAAVDIDDDELRKRYDEIGIDAIAKMRNAQADKAVMGILGDDWGKQQAANILGNLSMNPGAGGVAAAGAGMGMGMAAGGAFGSMAQQMFAPMSSSTPVQQPQPFQQAPSGRFSSPPQPNNTQAPPSPSQEDPMEVLGKLKRMLDAGLIEQAEYDAKKAEILSRM
jgi:membrane protease subunit (stomatin/prohibitin family)